MAWMLIYLIITPAGTVLEEMGLYPTMIGCFEERENLLIQKGNSSYFPINEQAICIRTNHT